MAEGSCESGHSHRVMRLARTRRVAVVVAVVGLVVLAGCSGLGGGGSDSTADGGDGSPPTADGGDGGAADVDPEQLRADAVSAIAEVDTYRIEATQETVVRGPRNQESTVTDRAALDRSARELRRNRTVTAAGTERQFETYLVDRTLYERSDVYVRQYSSEWVRTEVSENFSRTWRLQDVLGQARLVLENADSVAVTGVETVDGQEAYRTRAEISSDAFRGVLFDIVNIDPDRTEGFEVNGVEYVYWLDTDTARPLRTEAELSISVTLRGQTFDQNVSTTTTYEYDDVSVALPEAAEDAVNVTGGRTPRIDAGSGPRVAGPDAVHTSTRTDLTPAWRPRVTGPSTP